MQTIIRFQTEFVLIEIAAGQEARAVLLKHSYWPVPRISFAPEGARAKLDLIFPLLFEESEYNFLVQSRRSGVPVTISHRDERVIENLRLIPGAEPSTATGTVRFRQSVGLTTFVFKVDGEVVELTLEIFPAKLDYLEDYEAMLTEVRELDRALPFRYFDETYRKSAMVHDPVAGDLDWIVILRSQVDEIVSSLLYANRHPLISLDTKEEYKRADRVRRSGSQVRRTVSRGRGSGSWELLRGIGVVRHSIPVDHNVETFDSTEHRWLKGNLNAILQALTRLMRRLDEERASRKSRYGAPESGLSDSARTDLDQQRTEIATIANKLSAIEGLPILREAAGGHLPAGFSSLRMLRTPGYAEAYRAIIALRLGLAQAGGDVEVSVSRLGSLYEAWCFVEVLRQVEEITGGLIVVGLDEFVTGATLGTRLVKGRSVEATYELPDGRGLALRYNRSYSGLTGVHIPDIELAFSKTGWPDLIVLLDAKYRLDTNGSQEAFYGVPAPPQDAIGSLHRYRDAIVVERTGQAQCYVQPVVKGAALYPLSSSQSEGYESSKLKRALSDYGIGAIPLLPNNTGRLNGWLRELLALSHEDLASEGPRSVEPDFLLSLE